MLGVSFSLPRSGTVAFFATLFVAISLIEAKECSFDSKRNIFEYACNGQENFWTVVDKQGTDSKEITGFNLKPDHPGCLKTVQLAPLNSSSKVALRFFRSKDDDSTRSLTLRLIPTDGNCAENECVWNIESPADQRDAWTVLENQFPLKSTKDYHLQLEVNKGKGELIFDKLTISGLPDDYSKCSEVTARNVQDSDKAVGKEEALPKLYVSAAENEGNSTTDLAPGLAEISKNLMLTSASVLTLNHLLN